MTPVRGVNERRWGRHATLGARDTAGATASGAATTLRAASRRVRQAAPAAQDRRPRSARTACSQGRSSRPRVPGTRLVPPGALLRAVDFKRRRVLFFNQLWAPALREGTRPAMPPARPHPRRGLLGIPTPTPGRRAGPKDPSRGLEHSGPPGSRAHGLDCSVSGNVGVIVMQRPPSAGGRG